MLKINIKKCLNIQFFHTRALLKQTDFYLNKTGLQRERDSLTVTALACHAADPDSNPAGGDDFFN